MAKSASSEVESQIYDPGLAARMRAARLARSARAPNWPKLRKALRPELDKKRVRALALLGDWVHAVDLHDGHVAEVKLSARALMEHGVKLLERAAWIRHLHVTEYADIGPSLWANPSLRGIQSLGLVAQGITDEDVEAMASSPQLGDLRWLDLGGNALTERAYEALASSSSLAHLVYVGLGDNSAPSPVDQVGNDVIDGAVVETWTTKAGRTLERQAKRRLEWLHAPERFRRAYPPTPEDVATST